MENSFLYRTLSLPELGRMTIRPNPNTHDIAKVSYNVDLEKDRENLIAIPRPNVLSRAEVMKNDLDNINQRLDKVEERNLHLEEKTLHLGHENRWLKNELFSQRDRFEDKLVAQRAHSQNELSILDDRIIAERSQSSYYFGTLKIIRIWAKMRYEKIYTSKTDDPFQQFFSDFIRQVSTKKETNETMKRELDLSSEKIFAIKGLNSQRNIETHGEEEFARRLCSGDPTNIKDAVEELKMDLEEAESYKGKDSQIISIARAFLKAIEKEVIFDRRLK